MNGKQHVVLIGDSVLDNKSYVGNAPAVIEQVRQTLGEAWQATLLAVDGDVTDDVEAQLNALPSSATHLVISVGGNDALNQIGVFVEPVGSIGDAMLALARIRDDFARRYVRMLGRVLRHELPTVVCTIYDPNFESEIEQSMATAALAVFNDVITRQACRRGLPMIDLRTLFSEKAHYANPIEPAPPGGQLIANCIASILRSHDFAERSVIWC